MCARCCVAVNVLAQWVQRGQSGASSRVDHHASPALLTCRSVSFAEFVLGAGYVQGVRCHHCGHENELGAHFCASCGVPLSRDEADTSSLAGLGDLVEMLEADHDLAEVLAELPDGEGMLLVQRGPNAGHAHLYPRPRPVAAVAPLNDRRGLLRHIFPRWGRSPAQP